MTGTVVALVITGLIILVVLLFIYYYNRFIRLKNQAGESLSGIEVQLKRRYDLIPNVIDTVKGYTSHEKETLKKVVDARSTAMNAQGMSEKGEAENFLTRSLKSLFALAEAYPNLKANQNFIDLQKTLEAIEEQIQLARRYYNAVVREFNILCEAFPSVLVAGMFGFNQLEFLDFDDEVHETVKVTF